MKRGVNLQRDYREDAITGGSESAANTPHVEAKLAYSRDQRLRAMVQLRAPRRCTTGGDKNIRLGMMEIESRLHHGIRTIYK